MKSENLKERLKNIKVLIMDVDGTLTDGAMYYNENGEELKRFSTRDGMGITLLNNAGIQTGVITSEYSEIAYRRAEKLKINHIIIGSHDKKSEILNLSEKLNLSLDDVAYIGDDVNDIQAMQVVGVSACPNDAVHNVIEIADYTCSHNGGNGAVREFAEQILLSQNKSIILPENW